MKSIIKIFLQITFLLLIISSCGDDDDNMTGGNTGGGSMEPDCNGMNFCGTTPTVSNSELQITFLNHDLAVPVAKYSLLFKAELDGNPLTNLNIDDIEVQDNGKVEMFESENALIPDPQSFGFNILLLTDMSESITDVNALPKVKEAMESFVNTIIPESGNDVGEINIGIYYFDGDPDIAQIQNFTSDKTQLLAAISSIDESLTRDNSTNLNGAIISGSNVIINQVNSSTKLANVGALITFTDGTDLAGLDSEESASNAINQIQSNERDIDSYTIGLGGDIDQNTLQNFGSSGFFFAEDLDQLIPTFEEIGEELDKEVNSYYKMEYCSPRRAGQTEIITRITKDGKVSTVTSCINSDCTPDGC